LAASQQRNSASVEKNVGSAMIRLLLDHTLKAKGLDTFRRGSG
jgi:hypothetical protein